MGESVRVAQATRAGSALVAILAFVVPMAVLGTTGLNIEGQRAVLSRLDEAGSRVITVASPSGAGSIPASAVDRIARLSGVAWVVGLGPVSDVRNPQGAGEPTPVRHYRAVRAPVTFSSGMGVDGGHDAAFVSAASAQRLGLDGAYSRVEPGGLRIVGWFSADAPLTSLEAFCLGA